MIPFGPFRPDQPKTTPGISRNIVGALPVQDGNGLAYRPASKLNTTPGAAALASAPKGAYSAVKADGTYIGFVGLATSIQRLQADYTWTSIDTGLSLTAGDDWSFTDIGDFLLYTNTTEGMRQYDKENAGAASAVAGAPAARFIFTASNCVIALDCDGDNRRMENSALGDHTEWTNREANGKTLEDGEALQWGGDLSNGLAIVLQKNATRLIRFGGAAGTLFSISKLAEGIGSVGARSCAAFNGVAYWLDSKGFYMSNGGAPVPIGSGKVSRTFTGLVQPDDMAGVQCAVDPVNEIVWWYAPTIDLMYGYNWTVGEWTTLSADIQALFRMATSGYTLNAAGSLGTLNSLSGYPLNARFWQGGAPNLAAIDSDSKFAFFDGTYMAATLDTGVVNLGRSTLITSVTPRTNDSAATVAIGVADNENATISFGPDIAIQNSGRAPVRGRGKVVQYRVKHPADGSWNYSRGIDFEEGKSGGPR